MILGGASAFTELVLTGRMLAGERAFRFATQVSRSVQLWGLIGAQADVWVASRKAARNRGSDGYQEAVHPPVQTDADAPVGGVDT
jgi:hypothetical protein